MIGALRPSKLLEATTNSLPRGIRLAELPITAVTRCGNGRGPPPVSATGVASGCECRTRASREGTLDAGRWTVRRWLAGKPSTCKKASGDRLTCTWKPSGGYGLGPRTRMGRDRRYAAWHPAPLPVSVAAGAGTGRQDHRTAMGATRGGGAASELAPAFLPPAVRGSKPVATRRRPRDQDAS